MVTGVAIWGIWEGLGPIQGESATGGGEGKKERVGECQWVEAQVQNSDSDEGQVTILEGTLSVEIRCSPVWLTVC